MDELIPNLIFILIFTCPGFLIQKFLQYVNDISHPELSDFDKNIWAFFFSFLILILNYLSFMILNKNYFSISQLVSALDSFVFILKYMLLTGVNSIITAALAWVMINRVLFGIKKKAVKKLRSSILHSDLTVWEDMRRGRLRLIPNMSDMCIEIIKGGQVITQGTVQSHSETAQKDFLLSDVEAVRVYLDNDQSSPDELKMFPKILAEYYDAECDILIRIYDNENWIKHFGERKAD